MSNSQNTDLILSPELISKTYCNTKIRVHEVCFVWSIENFTFHRYASDALSSELFSSNTDEEYKWGLQLLLRTSNNTINLKIHLSSCGLRSDCYAKCNVHIVDRKPTDVLQTFGSIRYYDTNGHSIILISEEKLTNERSTLLPNDTLTIKCEIIYSSLQPFNVTSHQIKSLQQSSDVFENKVCQDLGMILKNKLFTDVILTTQGEIYPAHKNILAARSPVFAAMFASKMMEGENNCVDIKDIDGEALENVLQYVYTGNCDISIRLANRLLMAAEKYDLQILKKMCENELIENLSIENALYTLVFADLNCASLLKSETINFIIMNFAEVMNTKAWKNLDQSNYLLLKDICEALSSRSNLILCKYLKMTK